MGSDQARPSVLVSAVEGNAQKLDGGAMFGNVPKPMWERWFNTDDKNRIDLACRCLLIEIGDKKILCETGIGAFMEPKLADRFGVQDPQTHHLLQSLKKLGLTHESIDYVILSHLHFDHAGGILPTFAEIQAGHSTLLFPNAKYITSEEAFQRALTPHLRDRASFIPDLTEKLTASGRLILNNKNQIPGFFEDHVHFFFSQGHTPGQMLTTVSGETDSVVFMGDLVPGSAWMHLPITMGYDRFPEKLIDEKELLMASMSLDKSWFFFTHDPIYACSRVTKSASGKYECTGPRTDLTRQQI